MTTTTMVLTTDQLMDILIYQYRAHFNFNDQIMKIKLTLKEHKALLKINAHWVAIIAKKAFKEIKQEKNQAQLRDLEYIVAMAEEAELKIHNKPINRIKRGLTRIKTPVVLAGKTILVASLFLGRNIAWKVARIGKVVDLVGFFLKKLF